MTQGQPRGDEQPPQISRWVRWWAVYSTPVALVLSAAILVFLIVTRAWDGIAVFVGGAIAALVLHRWLWRGQDGDDG